MTPIQTRWHELAKAALRITPNTVSLVPSEGEPEGLADDLRCLARFVDALILEYGREAHSNGLISKDDVKDHFTDVLERAMDGNALWLLRVADDELRAAERSDYAEHNTLSRAYQGV